MMPHRLDLRASGRTLAVVSRRTTRSHQKARTATTRHASAANVLSNAQRRRAACESSSDAAARGLDERSIPVALLRIVKSATTGAVLDNLGVPAMSYENAGPATIPAINIPLAENPRSDARLKLIDFILALSRLLMKQDFTIIEGLERTGIDPRCFRAMVAPGAGHPVAAASLVAGLRQVVRSQFNAVGD